MNGYTEEMQLFLAEPDNKYYARLLLPEIADVLDVSEVTVGKQTD